MQLLTEVHTSDLVCPCHKRVQLRHEGKVLGVCPGAMYRGILFHEAARHFHTTGEIPAMEEIDTLVRKTLAGERRQLTESAAKNSADTMKEVAELIDLYSKRFADWFGASKIIGCEVPIRCTVDVDGEPMGFASHLDLLYRDPHGILCTDDYKTGDTEYEDEHAHRSLQAGMYYHALLHGAVCVGGEWLALNEEAHVCFVTVDNLWPYSRKTTAKDDTGQDREFVKGDLRPLSSIRRDVMVTNPGAIIDEFSTRVRMFRAGLFPTNPSSVACRVCESAKWCPSWSGQQKEDGDANQRNDW